MHRKLGCNSMEISQTEVLSRNKNQLDKKAGLDEVCKDGAAGKMTSSSLPQHQSLDDYGNNSNGSSGGDWSWQFDLIDQLTILLNQDCRGPLSSFSTSTPSSATDDNHFNNETLQLSGHYLADGASLSANQTTLSTISQPRAFEDPLFHLASALLLISYLAPSTKWGQVNLHTGLSLGFLVLSTWAWNIVCAPEVFVWYFAFTVLNSGQLIYILYQMRPITFDEDLEKIYQDLFLPMKISRAQFKRLVGEAGVKETSPTSPNFSGSSIAQIVGFHTGECYAIQNMTKTDRLALLISGRVNVVNDRAFLHHIVPGEFLDSPEFESSSGLTISSTSPGTTGVYGNSGSGTGEESAFKVTICAAVPSRCLVWQRGALEYLLLKDTHLATVMSTLISSDITKKLYSMNSRLKRPGMGDGANAHLDIRLPGLAGMLAQADPLQMERMFRTDQDEMDYKANSSRGQQRSPKGKTTDKKAITFNSMAKASSVSSGLYSLSKLRRATFKKGHRASSTSDLLKKVTSSSFATHRRGRHMDSPSKGSAAPSGKASGQWALKIVVAGQVGDEEDSNGIGISDRKRPLPAGKYSQEAAEEGDILLESYQSEMSQSTLSVS